MLLITNYYIHRSEEIKSPGSISSGALDFSAGLQIFFSAYDPVIHAGRYTIHDPIKRREHGKTDQRGPNEQADVLIVADHSECR
jgi:hypothetical protein